MENMPLEVLAGLFVCSHDSSALEEVNVWNVRIDKPVPDNYQAEKEGYPGSRLEIMNVFDGRRKVIWEKQGRFEAPNWMPDGKSILFNMDGFLWTIPLEGGEPEKLNTGFADNNNNDHGISFDESCLQ
jgi:Tol biopolymer transport system component